MRVIAISDTHNMKMRIPNGDMVIHAGDMTNYGTLAEMATFTNWFAELPHKYKIVIAGNHDGILQTMGNYVKDSLFKPAGVTYLQDDYLEIESKKIFGSPWTPYFCDYSFQYSRGDEAYKLWQKIPQDLDILITHGPPQTILDAQLGCADLKSMVYKRKPKFHIFGHIHQGHGTIRKRDINFINAAQAYKGTKPIEFDV